MNNLVIEKIGKTMGSGDNGSNTAASQTDLLKLLSQRGAVGIGGAFGGIGNLAAAAQARQNGSSIIRSYEALLQNSPSTRTPAQPATLPGPTRRKKKKRRRQPDMPKKACTPFMHFCAYFKRKLMEEGKEFPQFADFGKRAGELWRNMTELDKQKFNELSELDRQRYIKDMKEYEERKLAEKERERELQQQREQELQVLREKELERIQKQQREQMEQQQKHMEQQKQSPNNLLNMMNPMSHINPLMLAALNQSLMQTMMTNPELLKSMYSEAAKNYYYEAMKNIYQNATSQANGNPSPPATSVASSLGSSGMNLLNSTPSVNSSPLTSIGLNMNLISLLAANQLSGNGSRESPSPKDPSPSRSRKSPPSMSPPVINGHPLSALALDLSANRSHGENSTCASEEDINKEADGVM